MGSFSDYLENELLDHVLGGSDFARPATVYLALLTAAPDDTDTGSTLTEATYTGYARKSVTNDETSFPAASGGSKQNGTTIEFAECTGGSSTVTHVAIVDAATLGNVLAYGTLTTSKAVSNGDKLVFDPNDITLTLD